MTQLRSMFTTLEQQPADGLVRRVAAHLDQAAWWLGEAAMATQDEVRASCIQAAEIEQREALLFMPVVGHA